MITLCDPLLEFKPVIVKAPFVRDFLNRASALSVEHFILCASLSKWNCARAALGFGSVSVRWPPSFDLVRPIIGRFFGNSSSPSRFFPQNLLLCANIVEWSIQFSVVISDFHLTGKDVYLIRQFGYRGYNCYPVCYTLTPNTAFGQVHSPYLWLIYFLSYHKLIVEKLGIQPVALFLSYLLVLELNINCTQSISFLYNNFLFVGF
jgi:hypothetical protein